MSTESKKTADKIYGHMNEVNSMLEKAREMLKKKKPWKEIEAELGCKADPKTKTIEVELP